MKTSQRQLILSYFKKNPNRDIAVAEVIDWARAQWKKQGGGYFPPNTNALRAFYDKGILMRVKKGVYRYCPNGKKPAKPAQAQNTQKMIEVSKKEVIKLQKIAKKQEDIMMVAFYDKLLKVYKEHGY